MSTSDKPDEAIQTMPPKELSDAEIQWLRAFGAKMIALGIHAEDVALCMASMDRPDLTEDPEAAAEGEVEQWNAE